MAPAAAVVAPAAAVVAPKVAVISTGARVVAPAAPVVAPAAAVVTPAAADVVAAADPEDPRSTEARPVTSLHVTVVVMSVKVVQAVNFTPLVTKARVVLLLRMRNCFLTPSAPFRTNLLPVVQPELLVMSARLGGREEEGGRREEEEWYRRQGQRKSW